MASKGTIPRWLLGLLKIIFLEMISLPVTVLFLLFNFVSLKLFRFKKPEERQFLHNIMQVLLPQLYARVVALIEDSSEMSVEIQKQILKIFFALIQVSLLPNGRDNCKLIDFSCIHNMHKQVFL